MEAVLEEWRIGQEIRLAEQGAFFVAGQFVDHAVMVLLPGQVAVEPLDQRERRKGHLESDLVRCGDILFETPRHAV